MGLLNIQEARKWLGEVLHRTGPVSARTWRGMVDQGLPIGRIAGSPIISTDAVLAWLEVRASMPITSLSTTTGGSPRRPGRPKANRR